MTTAISTPAAKAAALVASLEESEEDPEPEQASAIAEEVRSQKIKHKRRRRQSLIASIILVLALAGSAFLGYRWTQTQYYVAVADGKVAIYQGIPQQLGPLTFSHLVETYDTPALDDLDDLMRERLTAAVTQPSLEAAREYVDVTVSTHIATTPTPTATPSASASAAVEEPPPVAPDN